MNTINENKIMQTIMMNRKFLPIIGTEILKCECERKGILEVMGVMHRNITNFLLCNIPEISEVVMDGIGLLTDMNGALIYLDKNISSMDDYVRSVDKPDGERGGYPGVVMEQRGNLMNQQYLIPNAHLDKSVLTEQEARELLGVIMERPDMLKTDTILNTYVKGYPDSAANKLVDYLGVMVYGPNNYIGPGKTGGDTEESRLIDILTTKPALSLQDAEARAHDVFLTAKALLEKNEYDADSILTDPLMRGVQVLAPLFIGQEEKVANNEPNQSESMGLLMAGVEPNPGPDVCYIWCRTRIMINRLAKYNELVRSTVELMNYVRDTSRQIKMLLVLGGVEQNPGPYEWDDYTTYLDALVKILSNPTLDSSYLNTQSGDDNILEMEYQARRGQYILKSSINLVEDAVQLRSNWAMLSGLAVMDIANPGDRQSRQVHRYSMWNKMIKAVLPQSDLGTALAKSLVEFSPFIALERTHSNMLEGDATLASFVRTPNVDYGVYTSMTKLLMYESRHCQLVGDETVGIKFDSVILHTPGLNGALNSVYPRTDNDLNPAINAWCVSATMWANILRGVVQMPGGLSAYDQNVAFVVGADTLTPGTRTYATLCHLEFPFGSSWVHTLARTTTVPFIEQNRTLEPVSNRCLIDGPKYNVIYVLGTNLGRGILLDDGNGGTVPVNLFDPVTNPNAVNIGPALISYYDNLVDVNIREGRDWRDVFEYLLRFMDLQDWYSACILAANVMAWKVPYVSYPMNLGNDQLINRPWYSATNGAPNVDVSFPILNVNTWLDADRIAALTGECNRPKMNCFGLPTFNAGDRPNAGNGIELQATPTAYYQESSPLTRYGIYMKYFTKDTLTGNFVTGVTKCPFRKLFYMIRELEDIFVEMSSKFYERVGVRNSIIYDRDVGRQTSTRQAIINALKDLQDAGLEALCGINPVRINKQWPDYGNAIVTTGVFNRPEFMNSMVVLFNHYETKERDGDKWEYKGVEFLPRISPGRLIPKGLNMMGTNNAAAQLVRNVNVTNISKVWVDPNDWYTAEGMIQQWGRIAWANFNTMHLLNPGGFGFLIFTYLTGEGRNDYQKPGVPIMATNEWLYYNSPAAPARGFLDARMGTLITALHSPPSYDDINGCRLSMCFGSDVEPTNMRPCLSIDGSGGPTLNYTRVNTAPIMGYLSKGYQGARKATAPPATTKVNPPKTQNPLNKDLDEGKPPSQLNLLAKQTLDEIGKSLQEHGAPTNPSGEH